MPESLWIRTRLKCRFSSNNAIFSYRKYCESYVHHYRHNIKMAAFSGCCTLQSDRSLSKFRRQQALLKRLKLLPDCSVQQLRRQPPLCSLLWEPEICTILITTMILPITHFLVCFLKVCVHKLTTYTSQNLLSQSTSCHNVITDVYNRT